MSPTTIRALVNEISKIAGAAGVAARYARTFAKGNAKHVGKMTYRTMRDMGSPVAGVKKALRREKGLFTKGLKDLKEGKKSGRGRADAALSVAGGAFVPVNAATTASDAFAREDHSGMGRSRLKRVAGWAGDQAGGLIGSRHGLPGAVAGSMLGRRIAAGKGA